MQIDKDLVSEVMAEIPLDLAMPELVGPRPGKHRELTAKVSRSEAVPEVKAGLLLYLDELDLSHRISQGIETPTGSWWHAMMHRREGDFSNSKYWYRLAASHPALGSVAGLVPGAFVDACQGDKGANAQALLEMQRQEWLTLMEWILHSDPSRDT